MRLVRVLGTMAVAPQKLRDSILPTDMDLFTYGTLQFDEVWSQVVGRDYGTMAGEVRDFAVYRVADADYPGMIPEPGASAMGTVYGGVEADSLARLDLFEGEQYERWAVEVVTPDSQIRQCQAYVIPVTRRPLLTDEPWTRQSFLASGGLARFLARYGGFRREAGSPQSWED